MIEMSASRGGSVIEPSPLGGSSMPTLQYHALGRAHVKHCQCQATGVRLLFDAVCTTQPSPPPSPRLRNIHSDRSQCSRRRAAERPAAARLPSPAVLPAQGHGEARFKRISSSNLFSPENMPPRLERIPSASCAMRCILVYSAVRTLRHERVLRALDEAALHIHPSSSVDPRSVAAWRVFLSLRSCSARSPVL